MNVVVLGAFARTCEEIESPFSKEVLKEAVAGRVPPKTVEVNLRAFDRGYRVADEILSSKDTS